MIKPYLVTREDSPCKDCVDRYLGCHGECNLYCEWKSNLEKVNEERKKYNQLYDIYKKHMAH